jgi:hypothetical protein
MDWIGFLQDILFIIGVGVVVGMGFLFLVAWAIYKWEKKNG